jgi:hypothetical protein
MFYPLVFQFSSKAFKEEFKGLIMDWKHLKAASVQVATLA